ncbi:hypothetical protein FXN61_00825 [Lentzea sp. PSKA42]|uniref:Uncharacterized protein n=1 Tax=Lentzea indica TaxID=2604800 RepID=A0ABX1F9F7_9PSEU|nr:hypothetical protein [Lentzea indica]
MTAPTTWPRSPPARPRTPKRSRACAPGWLCSKPASAKSKKNSTANAIAAAQPRTSPPPCAATPDPFLLTPPEGRHPRVAAFLFSHNGKALLTDYGIDISSWQGTNIDWPAVRGHNISFCSVKVTEATGYVNPAATAQVDAPAASASRPAATTTPTPATSPARSTTSSASSTPAACSAPARCGRCSTWNTTPSATPTGSSPSSSACSASAPAAARSPSTPTSTGSPAACARTSGPTTAWRCGARSTTATPAVSTSPTPASRCTSIRRKATSTAFPARSTATSRWRAGPSGP